MFFIPKQTNFKYYYAIIVKQVTKGFSLVKFPYLEISIHLSLLFTPETTYIFKIRKDFVYKIVELKNKNYNNTTIFFNHQLFDFNSNYLVLI